jgi:hydroxyacyl-ACP dehydratase HTD2-like protein with hotdog domain
MHPAVGDAIGPVRYQPTLTNLVMFAAAMWEFQRIHFDPAWARHEGLDAPIVHGPMLGTFLAQALRAWAGNAGRLEQLRWRNEQLAYVDHELEVEGQVTQVREVDGGMVCDCMLIIRAGATQLVSAEAVVRFSGSGDP